MADVMVEKLADVKVMMKVEKKAVMLVVMKAEKKAASRV